MLDRFCIGSRVAYEVVSDRPGHLPPEYARNSSQLIDFILKYIALFGNEAVGEPTKCCRNQQLNRTSCFPRKPIFEFVYMFAQCGRQSVKNQLPEYFEEMTSGGVFGTKKLLNSGVLKFMLG